MSVYGVEVNNTSVNITGDVLVRSGTEGNPNAIFITAETLSMGSLTLQNTASAQGGGLYLNPYAGGDTLFTIGSASGNGIAGAITLDSAVGGTAAITFAVLIQCQGTGGISVADSSISVQASSGRAGGILIDADQGNLIVSGTMSADGGSNPAGFISLKAATFTAEGATLSASDPGSGQSKSVIIAASTVDTGSGLTVLVNGDSSEAAFSQIIILPPDNVVASSNNDLDELLLTFTIPTPLDSTNAAVSITGGALTLTANGAYNNINLTGYPLTFENTGASNITSNSSIFITYSGSSTSGTNGLVFSGGDVNINSNATSEFPNGGYVLINIPGATATSGRIAITANALTAGNGGTIQISSTAANVPMGTSSGQISCAATGGSSSGNGGFISIDTTSGSSGVILINAASAAPIDVHVPGSGNGGSITLSSDSIAFATSGSDDYSLVADGAGNGYGGTISMTTASIDDSDATDGHSMTALGAGSGVGGSCTLTSTGTMALGNTDILADGGDTGNGGTIELTFSDSATLLVGMLSAITQQNTGGGTITITNSQDVDLKMTVSGSIQTTTNTIEDFSDISGSITLMVNDEDSNNIALTVQETGGFTSILSASAASITVTTYPAVMLGTDNITANSGDINITANSPVGTLVRGAPRLTGTANLGLQGTWTALNGHLYGTADTFTAIDSATDLTLMLPGPAASVTITCDTFTFGNNTYINGNEFSGNISMQSNGYTGLTVLVPNIAGFKSAKNIYIGSPEGALASQPLQIEGNSGGTGAELVLGAQGPGSFAVLQSYGPYTQNCQIGVYLGPNNPDNLQISSVNSSVALSNSSIVTNSSLIITAATDLQSFGLRTGSSSSPGALTISAGSGQWQSNGNVSCQGPIYANAGSSVTILENVTTLANGETSAPMSIASGGPITIFSNTTFSAYGEIDIYSGGTLSKTNPYPAYLPANVSASQVTSTSGTVYWGDSLAGLQVNPAGTTTFTVNGYDLVFYADGNTIQIGYSVTFTTLTVS